MQVVRFHDQGGQWLLEPERVSFAQCPDCRDKPLTDAEREASLLEAETRLLASPQFKGCPCCAWGVMWMPFDGQAAPKAIYSQ